MQDDPDRASRITVALQSLQKAERSDAADDLLPLVYAELRQQARAMIARERPGQTLQATALVHEAYMRVVGEEDPHWDGRRHFFAAATEAMRRILINQARRKKRVKHGGEFDRLDVDCVDVEIEPPSADVLAVDEALERLEAVDPRTREIVNLRYFGGFTTKETALTLGISVSTVEREWRFVRAWLKDALAR